jgi:hypothetical protein
LLLARKLLNELYLLVFTSRSKDVLNLKRNLYVDVCPISLVALVFDLTAEISDQLLDIG